MTMLGRRRTAKLPECTTNSDPSTTAEYQNQYFVKKIGDLLDRLPLGEEKCPLECDFCDKQFLRKEDLKSHIISIHEGNDYCGKNFTSEKDLNFHIGSSHTSSAKKPFEFCFVTACDVTRIVRNLNNTKATGVDEISTEVLKKGISVLASPIARICNLSLSTGIFPDIFKEAIVHPVFKGGGKNPREPASYRPISILPSLSKILEIIVHDAHLNFLTEHDILPETQYGFIPGRSVAMGMICGQMDWVAAKSKGEFVGVIAFDLSAAFDTIESTQFIKKLKNAGVHGRPLDWFKSYMTGRSQSVLWNDFFSDSCPLTHGVPQGSILGPLLFLLMIADLPNSVIGDLTRASMMSYADDCTIYVRSKTLDILKSDIEFLSGKMISYCRKTGLVLNNEKTQLLVSTKKAFEVTIGSCVIKGKPKINILGVDNDTNFTTNPYLQNLAHEARTRAALIKRLSFGMPAHLLTTFTNGILMGKILAAAPATILV